MTPQHRGTNQLRDATSPYLRAHANNPVDWHPWGEYALTVAREQDKPILLSVGYSACHWCHVMAHESFEDQQTAALMNRLFVNIKVDREERPDLDRIYQSAHQLLTQRAGGWPLTMFLSPDDLTPFFGGTYFPGEPRSGLPAFRDLLKNVAQAYREHGEDIRRQNLSMREALGSLNPAGGGDGVRLQSGPLSVARQQLENSFDEQHGGFGGAPKFPQSTSIERLLRHWAATRSAGQPDSRALDIAVRTLEHMALGGLFDQLGGGFYRYAVDELWMIPHFEKMLYDNGVLLALYADAWLATGNPLFRHTAERTADWTIREMQSPEGGYYSSLDADSEGEEGKYYTWTPEQVEALLEAQEYAVFAPCYGLDRKPNFDHRWHLHTRIPMDELCRQMGIGMEQATARLASARDKLLGERQNRVPPARDEKILTSWNALMIKGMARAGRVLGRADYLESAYQALDFLGANLWRDGRLLATCKDDKAQLPAYLDDYAYLIDALLELLQAQWRARDLELCIELAEVMLEHFQDPQAGGFYFTADDHEALIHRPKTLGDDSTPSGNGVAAFVLQRLGRLVGENRYLEAAEKTLNMAWDNIRQVPYAHGALLLALEEHLVPTETLILRGSGTGMAAWQNRAGAHYAPGRLCIAIPASQTGLPGLLNEQAPNSDAVIAYLCNGSGCRAPVHDYASLERELAHGNSASSIT